MGPRELSKFEINIMALDNSRHDFIFELEDNFFKSFSESLIEKGKGKAFPLALKGTNNGRILLLSESMVNQPLFMVVDDLLDVGNADIAESNTCPGIARSLIHRNYLENNNNATKTAL